VRREVRLRVLRDRVGAQVQREADRLGERRKSVHLCDFGIRCGVLVVKSFLVKSS
jgi:hypothetical protein